MKIKYRRFNDNDYTEVDVVYFQFSNFKKPNDTILRLYLKVTDEVMRTVVDKIVDIENVCEVYIKEI